MNYNFGNIILDLIITAISYLIIPFILFKRKKEGYNEKEKRKILIFNSVIVALIFIIIRILLNFEQPIVSFAPALLYYYINKKIWIKTNYKSEKIKKEKKHFKAYKKNDIKSKINKDKMILIITIIISIVIISILTFLLLKQNSIIEKKKIEIKEITNEENNCQKENIQLLYKNFFFEQYVVFEIEELRGKYLSYNCMNYLTKDKKYSFWAYNIEQAKAKGLEEYKCSTRIELGLENNY